MKIAYICTNYNNSEFTIAAVDSLMRNVGHDIEVFVVDNASQEQEVAKLRPLAAREPRVRLIENSENVGYFRGLNSGLKELRRVSPATQWVVAGNNDLEFPVDFCDRLAANKQALGAHSVVSPDIVTLDGEHQNPHVISGISRFREMVYDLYFSNYYVGLLIQKTARSLRGILERPDYREWQVARPIYQGHGSCYVLTPKFFAQFSELWAPTFLMSEEFFLSKQLKDVGEQVYYTPTIQVTHHWHGSLEKLPSRQRWSIARDAHREYRKYVNVFHGH